MNLSILYRGPLTSCNYDCGYCPFAKRRESAAQVERDQTALARFSAWLSEQDGHHWRVLVTPWGEALVRSWYRDAVVRLTHLSHVESVAVQTNLSCGLDWIEACRPESLALWATFHPTQVERAVFVRKVRHLHERHIRLSVGVVGVPAFLDEIEALRNELPQDVYLWINAQQPRPRPYSPQEHLLFSRIDSQFEFTSRRQRSFGQPCRTGQTVFTVDGEGDMRRCHFVDQVIGNIFESGWEDALQPRLCPNRFCSCFLGISQLETVPWEQFYGAQVLERIAQVSRKIR